MVWLAFLEFILVWAPVSGFALPLYAHVILGIVIFAMAYSNASKLSRTQCPARIRRIVKATVALSAFEGLLGILLYVSKTTSLPDLITSAAGFLHLGAALAIVTQAASTATAYDMWEEKEFV
jgi:3-methyladenine DNA glycosylase/8-oxoguanine DNA glycosylase